MIKVGIISDTHDVLRDEVIEELKTCDHIIHAGDVMKQELIDILKALAPLYVVKGNNDRLDIPEELFFTIDHYRFFLVHQRREWVDTDFYIYGHSHQYNDFIDQNVHYLNPGSCGRKRFSLPLTFMILYLDESTYRIEKKEID